VPQNLQHEDPRLSADFLELRAFKWGIPSCADPRAVLNMGFDAVVNELDSAELIVFHTYGHICLAFALVTLLQSDLGITSRKTLFSCGIGEAFETNLKVEWI
jgi:hypothetical protein